MFIFYMMADIVYKQLYNCVLIISGNISLYLFTASILPFASPQRLIYDNIHP